jgi:hypothetical protein
LREYKYRVAVSYATDRNEQNIAVGFKRKAFAETNRGT